MTKYLDFKNYKILKAPPPNCSLEEKLKSLGKSPNAAKNKKINKKKSKKKIKHISVSVLEDRWKYAENSD